MHTSLKIMAISCLSLVCFSSVVLAEDWVSLIESEFEAPIAEVCASYAGLEEEAVPFFALDDRGTPVGKCPSITVEGEDCLENTFGKDHKAWKKAVVKAAKEAGKKKFEKEKGTSSCATTNGDCKLCTPSSGLVDGTCEFSPSQTEGRDDRDDPQAAPIKRTSTIWFKKGDKNTMCAKVEVGCPYECEEN